MTENEIWAIFAANALGKRKADQAALAADLMLKEYKKRYPNSKTPIKYAKTG